MNEKILNEIVKLLTKIMVMLTAITSVAAEETQNRADYIRGQKRYINSLKNRPDAALIKEQPLDYIRCKLMNQADKLVPVLDVMMEELHSESMPELANSGETDEKTLQTARDVQELTEALMYAQGALQELSDIAADQLTIPHRYRHKVAV